MRGWALALLLVLLAGDLAAQVSGPPWLLNSTIPTSGVTLRRRIEATLHGTVPDSIWHYQLSGSGRFSNGWTDGGLRTPYGYIDRPVSGWTGLSEENSTVNFTTGAGGTYTFSWRVGGTSSDPLEYSVTFDIGPVDATVTYGGGSSLTLLLPPLKIDIYADGSFSVDDPLAEPEPDPEKEIEGGILLLDNLTGTGLELDFGDEALRLQPGYNAFPFYGEVEEGFPKAIGDDWQLTRVVGADGQTYWVGRIAPGSEGGPEWVAPPSAAEIQVMPPQTGQTGPTVKIPNGASEGDLKDYVTLPAGMTKGNNVPLPGGMSPGNGTPKGVTPGDAGALKDGVISGGTSYLPSGYSAGTVQGNSPAEPGVPKDGTTGKNPGAVVQKDSGGEDDAGPYIAGPSLDGLLEEGRELGQEAADRLGVEIGEGLGELGQTVSVFGPGASDYFLPEWSAPPATFFGGADKSWLNFEVPIGTQMVQIEVPENIINLIRAILLWVVKIVFVMACIRVAMR